MYTNLQAKTKVEKPEAAKVLIILGWIFIASGLLAGLALGSQEVSHGTYYTYTTREFSLTIALACWMSGAVSGTLLIGMGKIIELLTIIANKDYIIVQNSNEQTQEETRNDKKEDIADELPDL